MVLYGGIRQGKSQVHGESIKHIKTENWIMLFSSLRLIGTLLPLECIGVFDSLCSQSSYNRLCQLPEKLC